MVAFELFAELRSMGITGRQVVRTLLEMAVETADFFVQSVIEVDVGAFHGNCNVAASKTAGIR